MIEQMNLNEYQLTNFYVLSPWFILTNPYGAQITISQFIEPIQFGPKKGSKLLPEKIFVVEFSPLQLLKHEVRQNVFAPETILQRAEQYLTIEFKWFIIE